ncbi:MAG: hypothetical protein KF796_07355 [Ramlibacter sp.]|nr:hypothetical protein [Ramlibacter sp.]
MHRYPVAFLLSILAACTDSGGYYLEVKPAGAASAASVAASSDDRNLVLPLEVDQQVAATFVRIGFALNKGQRFQSTEFLTPRLRTSQAAQLISLVTQYNEFNGQRVAAAVEKLRGRVSGVEFGREGSPVLYIELPYWTHQREEATPTGMGVKIPDADNDKLVAELRRVFVGELKADEFSVNRRRVRVWWD